MIVRYACAKKIDVHILQSQPNPYFMSEIMAEHKKEHGFTELIKGGLGFVSQIITASILPPIVDGAEQVMNNIEERMALIQKRFMRKMSSLMMIWLGGIFLIFALFFFIIESFGWGKAAAFFSIGIIIFVIGLLMKLGEPNR